MFDVSHSTNQVSDNLNNRTQFVKRCKLRKWKWSRGYTHRSLCLVRHYCGARQFSSIYFQIALLGMFSEWFDWWRKYEDPGCQIIQALIIDVTSNAYFRVCLRPISVILGNSTYMYVGRYTKHWGYWGSPSNSVYPTSYTWMSQFMHIWVLLKWLTNWFGNKTPEFSWDRRAPKHEWSSRWIWMYYM